MDFSWDENQRDLKDTAKKFAQNKLSDGVVELDKKGEFSHDGWQACAEFGLQSMFLSEEYGGMGLNALDFVAVMEGIGSEGRDNGLIFSVSAHIWGCEIPLFHHGTEEQKKKYLTKLGTGEYIGANAMTEPDIGSDVFAMQTTAVKENDYYVLNGNKMFVTNAPAADLFIVYAKTDNSKGFFGISCFLIERETDGLIVGKKIEKMGLKTSPMSDIALDNCKIPSANLIGKEGSGGVIFNESMEWERGFILANCIGVMERQLHDCVKYAKVRKVGGKPIGEFQSVSNKISEMRVRLETSRLMQYKMAWLKSNNKNALLESAMSKLYISESYIENCRDAMQIYGGYGYMVEYELERELRDALASSIYCGTSEIQKNIIGKLSGL